MPVTLLYQHSRKTKGLSQTNSPRLSAQDCSQKLEASAYTMDRAADARPFPFFKLPGELRNKIYRLAVVTGGCLIVQNMHLREFEMSRDNGTYQSRSTYLATDHECYYKTLPGGWPSGTIPSCLFKDLRFAPVKTTYTLGTSQTMNTTTTMLSLNKESREEVAFIFYGENTFHFTAISSLIPFIKDRSPETRKYIQRINLNLTVDDRDWDAIFTEYSRPATWNTAFSMLLKLPHVNVKKLFVEVNDRKAKLLKDGMSLRSRSMLWLHKLSKLENLDMLGVRYDVGEWKTHRHQRHLNRLSGEMAEEVNTQTEQELWRFLAPKMLKKEANDHSPDSLQKRRIWELSDTFASCRTYTVQDVIGSSGIDSDSE